MFEVGKTPKSGSNKLSVTICGPMPFLKPSFESWPLELRQGEIRPFTLRLANQGTSHTPKVLILHTGSTSISCVSVAFSHPECFAFPAHSRDGYGDLFECLENLDVDEEERTRLQLSACVIPLEGVLEPGQHVDVPMWIRGNAPVGATEFCFVFYYTPADPQSDQKYRTQRACMLAEKVLTQQQRDQHQLLYQYQERRANTITSCHPPVQQFFCSLDDFARFFCPCHFLFLVIIHGDLLLYRR